MQLEVPVELFLRDDVAAADLHGPAVHELPRGGLLGVVPRHPGVQVLAVEQDDGPFRGRGALHVFLVFGLLQFEVAEVVLGQNRTNADECKDEGEAGAHGGDPGGRGGRLRYFAPARLVGREPVKKGRRTSRERVEKPGDRPRSVWVPADKTGPTRNKRGHILSALFSTSYPVMSGKIPVPEAHGGSAASGRERVENPPLTRPLHVKRTNDEPTDHLRDLRRVRPA